MNISEIMAKATAAVEFMYDKTATIKRYQEYEKPSGATGMEWIPIHVDVPCRVSHTTSVNTEQGIANTILYADKLFCSTRYLIMPGDMITVNGREYESANEPLVYVSHQEVALTRKDRA